MLKELINRYIKDYTEYKTCKENLRKVYELGEDIDSEDWWSDRRILKVRQIKGIGEVKTKITASHLKRLRILINQEMLREEKNEYKGV